MWVEWYTLLRTTVWLLAHVYLEPGAFQTLQIMYVISSPVHLNLGVQHAHVDILLACFNS